MRLTPCGCGPPPRAECTAWTLRGLGCAPGSLSPFPAPSPSCVAQPIKHKRNVCVLPLPGTSPCSSVHISVCGLLAKRHRIYALKLGKAVGGGPLPDVRPVVCEGALPSAGGWRRGGGEAGWRERQPFARICILAPDVGSPAEEASHQQRCCGRLDELRCAKWAFCPRRQLLQRPSQRAVQRVQEGDEPSPSAASRL